MPLSLPLGLGCVPDPPDPRDFLWRVLVRPEPMKLPRAYGVRTCGPVLDQGAEPRCVAFSTATVKMVDEYRERKVWYAFDPVWLYELCKQHDGKPNSKGTNLRIALGLVAFGIRVDEGIYKPVNGRVPEPSGKPFGGHAMVINGWDDDLGAFRIKNSWGYDWGDRGFAWLPYSHFDAYKWNAWKTVDQLGE